MSDDLDIYEQISEEISRSLAPLILDQSLLRHALMVAEPHFRADERAKADLAITFWEQENATLRAELERHPDGWEIEVAKKQERERMLAEGWTPPDSTTKT